MPPPPPQRSRSFEELRSQVNNLKEQNERLRAQMDSKPQPTADEIARRNPNRANPKPDNPEIKLDQYCSDWLEEEHTNVLVELKDDFEDYVINEHATVVETDNVALIGMKDEEKEEVKDGFKAYSVLNIAYRLLLTMPAGLRLQAQELINTIKADDTPENTPLISEMSSHLGKTKTDHYGNIRINYQLHHAKKRIIKGLSYVYKHKQFKSEISHQKDVNLDDLFDEGESWKRGVFLDNDSLVYLRSQAKNYLEEMADTDYKFKIDYKTYKCSIPSIQESKYTTHGKYTPTMDFVLKYIDRIGWIEIDEDRNHIAAAMISFVIDLNFAKARTTTLGDLDSRWKGTPYSDTTFNNLMEYLGIIVLDDYFSYDDLKDSYGLITTKYRTLIEPKVKAVFKTVPLKKDEFGTEALMMQNPNWTKGELPAVTSGFKINDRNHIVASGIFSFTSRVKFAISDKMYLKSPVRTIVSEMISKFCRKK